jgi:hypothetical protein
MADTGGKKLNVLNVNFWQHGHRVTARAIFRALLLPSLRSYPITKYKVAASAERAINKNACYHITTFLSTPLLPAPPQRVYHKNSNKSFYNQISYTAEILLHCVFFSGNGFIITSLISFWQDMSEMILNLVPKEKAQRSKNLCSTRDLVTKLFIAILVIYTLWGGAVEYLTEMHCTF